MAMQPVNVTRDDLAKFIKEPRTIRAFEALANNSGAEADTIAALVAAPLIGQNLSDVFTNDRYLDGSSDISLTDGGPKGALSINLTDIGSPGTYGSDSKTLTVTVDSKGRITNIVADDLNSDNVTEGATHLFFTNVRARNALSEGAGIDYNSVTGQIAVDPGYFASGTYTPTLTNVANLDASAAYPCQYLRVGNTVTVSGLIDIDPTTLAVQFRLGVSLPIPSNFTAVYECGGTACAQSQNKVAAIRADPANDRAELIGSAGDTVAYRQFFTFQYTVLP